MDTVERHTRRTSPRLYGCDVVTHGERTRERVSMRTRAYERDAVLYECARCARVVHRGCTNCARGSIIVDCVYA